MTRQISLQGLEKLKRREKLETGTNRNGSRFRKIGYDDCYKKLLATVYSFIAGMPQNSSTEAQLETSIRELDPFLNRRPFINKCNI